MNKNNKNHSILQLTENITLKILDEQDAEVVYRTIDTNRNRLKEWLGWLDATNSTEDSRKFIKAGREGFNDEKIFRYGIFVDDKFAGIIELQSIDYTNKKSGIGYWLAKGFEGKGIMTASVNAVLNLAFNLLNLNRIELHIATENLSSNKVALRLGFKKEGVFRQNEWLYNHFVDHNIYAVLRDEWNPR